MNKLILMRRTRRQILSQPIDIFNSSTNSVQQFGEKHLSQNSATSNNIFQRAIVEMAHVINDPLVKSITLSTVKTVTINSGKILKQFKSITTNNGSIFVQEIRRILITKGINWLINNRSLLEEGAKHLWKSFFNQ